MYMILFQYFYFYKHSIKVLSIQYVLLNPRDQREYIKLHNMKYQT